MWDIIGFVVAIYIGYRFASYMLRGVLVCCVEDELELQREQRRIAAWDAYYDRHNTPKEERNYGSDA